MSPSRKNSNLIGYIWTLVQLADLLPQTNSYRHSFRVSYFSGPLIIDNSVAHR